MLKIKKIKLLGIILIIILVFAGCKKSEDSVTNKDEEQTLSLIDKKELNKSKDKTLGKKKELDKNNEERLPGQNKEKSFIREDEKGLVQVHVNDGQAKIYFDLEKWEELFNMSQWKVDEEYTFYFRENNWKELFDIIQSDYLGEKYYGPFYVECDGGRVKDVCIEQVEGINFHGENSGFFYSMDDPVFPMVYLLLEDGSVEFFKAVIEAVEPYNPSFSTYGRLPWIKDIVGLSSGTSDDGIGSMTIFGHSKEGSNYDLRIPSRYLSLTKGPWTWNELDEESGYSTDYYQVLILDEDGGAILKRGTYDYQLGDENPDPIIYKGSYQLPLIENDLSRVGTISFDFYADEKGRQLKQEDKIRASFFLEIYYFYQLYLYPFEGANLFGQEENLPFVYEMYFGYDPFEYDPFYD